MSIVLQVEDYNSEGAGVCRHEGKVVFVPYAIPGETIEVNIGKEHKTYSEAEIMNILSASEERRQPPCDIFYECGGCSLMHMTYKEQLRFKKQKVENALERIGGIDCKVNDVIGMDDPYGYRNKAQYSVKGSMIGFFKKGTHEIIETQRCHIMPDDTEDIKNRLRGILKNNTLITGAMIRRSYANGEISVILQMDPNAIKDDVLTEEIKNISDKIVSIDIYEADKDRSHNLYGRGYIEEKLGEYSFRIYPDTFFQVNTEQTKKLYDVILKYADLKGTENALDLYCGAGTITSCLSAKAKNVIGVDSGKQSIRSALENVQINSIKNISFIRSKTEDVLGNIDIRPDIVVMDPPRTGCDKKVLKDISDMAPEKIIYVSCNPSTLARDVKILYEYGYECREAQPVDMFPQTEHVECVVLMSKLK